MFMQPDEGVENWRFRESERYRAGSERTGPKAHSRLRMYAFPTGDRPAPGKPPASAIRPALLPDHYPVWFDELMEDRAEILDSTTPLNLRRQIDAVVTVVVNFREGLFSSVAPRI